MTVGSTVPEIRVEVWSGNHPFYTGKQQLLDTTGNVDKFRQRVAKAAKAQEVQTEKKPRKVRTTVSASSTLKKAKPTSNSIKSSESADVTKKTESVS